MVSGSPCSETANYLLWFTGIPSAIIDLDSGALVDVDGSLDRLSACVRCSKARASKRPEEQVLDATYAFLVRSLTARETPGAH